MLNLGRAVRLATRGENWAALARFFSVYSNPVSAFLQEIGALPLKPVQQVNTPAGKIQIALRGPDDLATISAMFCRGDYMGAPDASVVVDIGANVGVAAAFFLSQSASHTSLYAYEPATRNLEVLRRNMAQFTRDDVLVVAGAVGVKAGRATFHLENTGKFGGLMANSRTDGGETIDVEVVAINDILDMVVAKHGRIDVLKIDTEGTEVGLIHAIEPRFWPLIKTLFVDICEAGTMVGVAPADFKVRELSGVARLTR